MKTIIVLEDSTRANFGGGQKMTLMVCDILKEQFKLRFVDFSDSTRYAKIVKERYGDDSLMSIGHGQVQGYTGVWTWLKMTMVSILYIFSDTNKILKGLKKENCISYTTSKRGLLIAAFMKWRYGIPYIHHAHLVENPDGSYFKFAKQLFGGADSVLCVSKTVLNSIRTPNCKLIYNPSLNERGYKGTKSDRKYVVAFVGSLIPIKGIEYFVDAAKLCPSDIEFRIYGEGALRQSLEERSDGRVRFMGFESNIIDRYYEDIDILVIPTILQEALSLVAVDAKSVGLPCIVTSPGGQAEIVRDGVDGYHVPMKQPQAIAEAVMRLTNNIVEYNRMSEESYKSFKIFAYRYFKSLIRESFSINS